MTELDPTYIVLGIALVVASWFVIGYIVYKAGPKRKNRE